MFPTLRDKLIVSYLLLVFLCLLLLGAATGVLLTRVQRRANLARTQIVARSLAQRIDAQPLLLRHAPDLMERLQREEERLGDRILVVARDGEILLDSGDSYTGQRVPPPLLQQNPRPTALPPGAPSPQQRQQRSTFRPHTFEDGQAHFLVYVRLPAAQRPATLEGAEFLAIALKVRDVDPPWGELLKSLVIPAALVVLLAVGLAYLLASSITRPVRRMTRAAESIGEGNYEHEIPASGNDEVARLARAFTKMAREVSSAQRIQRDFMANVSHDLRTPLTSIQGFSQAILDGAVTDDKGYQRAAEIIHSNADRMAQLVENLLELARLEAGQLDLAPEPVPVARLLDAEVLKARLQATHAGLALAVEIPDDLPHVNADATRLGRALANLTDNAVKYSRPAGRVSIVAGHVASGDPRPQPLTVCFGQPPHGGAWVHVTWTNASDPIPEADLGRLFERFYRQNRQDGPRQRTKGTGLGLAIVRETILAHGGSVEVSSDAERGTRFRVWLPAMDGEANGR